MEPSESGELPEYARGVRVSAGQYVVEVHPGHLSTFERLASVARLVDVVDLRSSEGRPCSVTVSERGKMVLVASFRYQLEGGLGLAVALLPDVHRLFVGAGDELFCYDLAQPRRLWRDNADTGLWGWEIVGDTVLMSAELEFAAWDKSGEKLWSTFVEPPWSYVVADGSVALDVMGEMSRFTVREGPERISH
jgi:hypothetical protein